MRLLLVTLAISIVVILFLLIKVRETSVVALVVPTPTKTVITPTPTVYLSPTPSVTKEFVKNKQLVQKPTQTIESNGWAQYVEGKTTYSQMPADDRMATADELFNAINSYRASHGLATLQKSDTLCSIANARANELLSLGKLDGHAGIEKYANAQTEFGPMREVLFGGLQPQLAVHIVEWGWDRSLTGHRNSLQSNTTHGCGGIAGYFAVFIFASH